MKPLDQRDTATIVAMWCARTQEGASRAAMHVRRDGKYQPVTWGEMALDVRRTAAALAALGVATGDRVVLVSRNRYEWVVCDLAIQMARAVHVPIHASFAGPQISYQILDSGAKLVVISGSDQAQKLIDEAAKFPRSLQFVSLDPCPAPIGSFAVRLLSDLVAKVDDAQAMQIEKEARDKIKPDDLATILYTSGTTGDPKGVMLCQKNIASNTTAMLSMVAQKDDDVRLTWLPLSHIFARTCDLYTWIAAGGVLALADSPEAIVANCQEIHPTLINGVPYFWDKLERYLVSQGLADKPGALAGLLGGRARLCCSGGAALPDHTAHFFDKQGVFLFQGYGLTETSPTITTCRENEVKLGTVGKPMPGIEVRIADDGEILTRGPHVMVGYWNKPEATAEVIRDGWFHTGDLGELDDEGYLKITGRKKEMIVTAAGKNISPVNLEALLTGDPLIAQAFIIGDARNYVSALIVVNPEPLKASVQELEIPFTSIHDALNDPQVRELYAARIAQRLAGVSHYEQVQKFTLLETGFTAESGEMTLTLKLRRKVIEKNYAQLIEAMYGVVSREPKASPERAV